MSESKDFKPGEWVTWFRTVGRTDNHKPCRVRVLRVRPTALHVEFEPHPGFKTIRYVPYASVEKIQAVA